MRKSGVKPGWRFRQQNMGDGVKNSRVRRGTVNRYHASTSHDAGVTQPAHCRQDQLVIAPDVRQRRRAAKPVEPAVGKSAHY